MPTQYYATSDAIAAVIVGALWWSAATPVQASDDCEGAACRILSLAPPPLAPPIPPLAPPITDPGLCTGPGCRSANPASATTSATIVVPPSNDPRLIIVPRASVGPGSSPPQPISTPAATLSLEGFGTIIDPGRCTGPGCRARAITMPSVCTGPGCSTVISPAGASGSADTILVLPSNDPRVIVVPGLPVGPGSNPPGVTAP